MPYPVTVIDPGPIGQAGANAGDIRPENTVGGITYAVTENSSLMAVGPDSIGLWSSPNNIKGPWSYVGAPVIPGPGAWDDNDTISPSLVQFQGTWFLYYSASFPVANNYSIGVATASTLPGPSTWTKYASNPIITGSNDADPCVIQIGSQLVMYFNQFYPAGIQILYSLSSDGFTWGGGGQSLVAASMGDWDFGQHGIIEPVVFANKNCFYEMTYTTIDAHNVLGVVQDAQFIGQAISPDGITFTRNPVGPSPPDIWFYGGGGQWHFVQQDGLRYCFTDSATGNPPTYSTNSAVGLSLMADP